MDDLIKELYTHYLENLPYSSNKDWDQMEEDESWLYKNLSTEEKQVFHHYKNATNRYYDKIEFVAFQMGLKYGMNLFRSILGA